MPRPTNLAQATSLVEGNRLPTPYFRRAWQAVIDMIDWLERDQAISTTQIDQRARMDSLRNSYVYPLDIISAVDAGSSASITIDAHERIYGSGATVNVPAVTLTGLAYETAYWLWYDNPARNGSGITITADSDYRNAFPNEMRPDRHFVGAVMTPAVGGTISYGGGAAPSQYIEG